MVERRKRVTASSTKRKKLVDRLWKAAEAQVSDIETRLTALDGDGASLEKDARTLGLLAKFLKELVSIECLIDEVSMPRASAKVQIDDDDVPPRDLGDFRRELARRLDQMRSTRDTDGSFDQSEPELA